MKAKYFNRLCIMIWTSIIAITLSCQKGEDPNALKMNIEPDILISQLEKEIPELMDNAMIPGLSIALIRDGQITWTKGFGVKDNESMAPADEETVYEACSLSKPVFAFAVMKLVERGLIDLDRPLIEYVTDEYIEEKYVRGKIEDPRFRKITARMVLTHSPGFPNWRGRDDLTIRFEPGEKFSYSGEGFQYLQAIVESLTSMALNEFMNQEVFSPLGMINSSYVWKTEYEERSAHPHGFMQEKARKGKPENGMAAATLHTTAPDFARFIAAVMNKNGLLEDTISQMLSTQIVTHPEVSDSVAWGLGVGLEKTPHGPAFWHWGDNYRFRCFFVAYPEQNLGVVYFTNSFYGLAIRQAIVEAAIGGVHPSFRCGLTSGYGNVNTTEMTFTRTLVKQGIDAAIQVYRDFQSSMNSEDIVAESVMNNLGYQMMRMERFDDAITLFQLNVDAFPDSWNVYDSLGEALAEKGDVENAIINYEKSIELNPENQNGKEILEKLKQNLGVK